MFGTFHGCIANEIVIKRRGNIVIVCALMLQKMPPTKFYFLIGYSETLLSYFYKCPVKLEIQTLKDKAIYKYIWFNCADSGTLFCNQLHSVFVQSIKPKLPTKVLSLAISTLINFRLTFVFCLCHIQTFSPIQLMKWSVKMKICQMLTAFIFIKKMYWV